MCSNFDASHHILSILCLHYRLRSTKSFYYILLSFIIQPKNSQKIAKHCYTIGIGRIFKLDIWEILRTKKKYRLNIQIFCKLLLYTATLNCLKMPFLIIKHTEHHPHVNVNFASQYIQTNSKIILCDSIIICVFRKISFAQKPFHLMMILNQ